MSEEKRVMTKSREGPARTFNGYLMLLVLLAVAVIGFWLLTLGAPGYDSSKIAKLAFAGRIVGSVVLFLFVLTGFYMLQPN